MSLLYWNGGANVYRLRFCLSVWVFPSAGKRSGFHNWEISAAAALTLSPPVEWARQ